MGCTRHYWARLLAAQRKPNWDIKLIDARDSPTVCVNRPGRVRAHHRLSARLTRCGSTMSQVHTPQAGPSSQPPAAVKRKAQEGDDRRPPAVRPRHYLPPPHLLADLVSPDDKQALTDLLTLERKLDWTLLRKKAELNDALGRPVKTKRTLRLFISNTAYNQAWQAELDAQAAAENVPGADVPLTQGAVDVETGKGIPGWCLKIEGRLLDSGNVRLDRSKKKFSTFVNSLVIDFDNREPPTYPDGNIVEWHAKPPPAAPLDGFECRRRGDQNVRCRITIHLNHSPERFKVLAPLCDIIGVKEDTRGAIMAAVWKYCKIVGAQDKDDGTKLRLVGGLEKIIPDRTQNVQFYHLPEYVNRFLTHPDPVTIYYDLRVDKDFNQSPICYDIPLELDDPLKSKLSSIVQTLESSAATAEIVSAEDEVAACARHIHETRQRAAFFESFAEDPQAFIQNWLAAQARDLDAALGNQIGVDGTNGGGVTEEDLRRSELFTLPWVKEAVVVHEAMRAQAVGTTQRK